MITMEGDSAQYVEAVLVKDGKIAFVGLKSEAENLASIIKTGWIIGMGYADKMPGTDL